MVNHCRHFWRTITFLKLYWVTQIRIIGGKIHYSFNKYCIATVSVDRMKECDRCDNWFHKICEDFNCEDQISKVNRENQWFCCYCIAWGRRVPSFDSATYCDGVVLEIYLDHKFQWLQEGLQARHHRSLKLGLKLKYLNRAA